jgi:hypothetical protein
LLPVLLTDKYIYSLRKEVISSMSPGGDRFVLKVVPPPHYANDYAAAGPSETTYFIEFYFAFKAILYVSIIAEPFRAKLGPGQRAEREHATI